MMRLPTAQQAFLSSNERAWRSRKSSNSIGDASPLISVGISSAHSSDIVSRSPSSHSSSSTTTIPFTPSSVTAYKAIFSQLRGRTFRAVVVHLARVDAVGAMYTQGREHRHRSALVQQCS